MKKLIGLGAVFACVLLVTPALASADTTPPPPTWSAWAVAADGTPVPWGGWTNQNLTVTLECVLDGVPHDFTDTFTQETPSGYSTAAECYDKENRYVHAIFPFGIDKTPPVVTPVASPAANSYGWANKPVTVTFQCTDSSIAGIASTTAPVTFSTEGSHTTLGSCTDNAGNTATVTSPIVNIDLTPPVVKVASVTPAPNAAGWNNSPVTVTVSCTDALSGTIVTGSVVTDEGETAGGNPGTAGCSDKAGNFASVALPNVKIDRTPPTLTFSSSYTPNTWTSHDVSVVATCSDDLSGTSTAPQSTTLTSSGQTFTASCTDNAGNVTTKTFGPVKIDRNAPTIVAHTGSYTPGTWTGGDVTVTFTCTDDASGVASVPPAKTFSTDTKDGSATGTCTDAAGNGASTTVQHIDVDKTRPTLTLTSEYTPGTWTNADVSVAAACTDSGSGVATAPKDGTLSADGANQTYSASCTDAAGNIATSTFGPVDIDKTAPTLAATTGAYTPGAWTAGDVTATFSCQDGLSGVADVTSPFTFSSDVRDGSVTGHCLDNAGNEATTTVDHVDVDKTPPTISGTPSATGWTNAPVTVTFTCDDSGSGVATCTSPVTVSTEGADQSVTGTATDNVGHSSSTSVDGIDIDLTAPLVSFSGNAGTYGILDTIAITCSANDFLSGIATSSCPTVDAPAWQYTGTHTLDATATDVAGNVSSASATFTVVVRADDLATLVQQLVTNAGVAGALAGMLENGNVNAFDHLVEAQTGKSIDPATAALLLQLAGRL